LGVRRKRRRRQSWPKGEKKVGGRGSNSSRGKTWKLPDQGEGLEERNKKKKEKRTESNMVGGNTIRWEKKKKRKL